MTKKSPTKTSFLDKLEKSVDPPFLCPNIFFFKKFTYTFTAE